jgi:predicted kinase
MSGRLIVFSGPACSGKTELAARLAADLRAPHLQMDATRARLMPDSAHTRADRRVAYRAMHFASELMLDHGGTVILDAQYGHPEDRNEVEQIVGRTQSELYLIECRVDPDLAARRFRERPANHPGLDLTEDLVIKMARTFPYSGRGLSIDTGTLPVHECERRIRQYLGSGTPVRTEDTRASF